MRCFFARQRFDDRYRIGLGHQDVGSPGEHGRHQHCKRAVEDEGANLEDNTFWGDTKR